MSRFAPVRRLLAAAPFALVSLGGCSDSAAPDTGAVALSFAARGDVATAASGATATTGGTIVVGVGGTDTLRLTSVRLVIDELELLQSAGGACTDDSRHGVPVPGCVEIESGPYFVDLPVNGALTSALTMSIPGGSYGKLEMKLRQANSGDDRGFNSAHPEMSGASVVASGTYRGQPFTWRGDVEADLELYFSPAFVVDGAGNVTVNIDVGGWFRSGNGGIIDPSTAGAGQPNFATVASNIAASFGAFSDDDHDGRDDHGGRSNDD
jgi:hypothetical protein